MPAVYAAYAQYDVLTRLYAAYLYVQNGRQWYLHVAHVMRCVPVCSLDRRIATHDKLLYFTSYAEVDNGESDSSVTTCRILAGGERI